MTSPAQQPIVLRAAAVWGTTVLATRVLDKGESLQLGAGKGSLTPKPDSCAGADQPIRAVGSGWELDARGATGGELVLRGRRENPAELARSGAPIPIVPGDFGLIQYDSFSIFFQFTEAPQALPRRRRIQWPLVLSFLFSCIAVGGGLALIWAVTTPIGIPKPLELTSNTELAARFNLEPQELTEPMATDRAEADAAPKDAGAKDKRAAGAGRAARGPAGKLGLEGREKKHEQPGEPGPRLGGMAEVLSSDVGDEIKKTLNTISSVADALGGLRSGDVVLGQGRGMALRGPANGGGGSERDGVPFGSGTLDTGWGNGKGVGFGAGSGAPGASGPGGRGTGPGDEGSGTGTGERQLAAKEAARSGQGLTPGQIQRVVLSRMGAFQACYEIATARDPSLKGGVTVSFGIGPTGTVSTVSISNSTLSNARVEGCITRQFSRLKFPTADKPTNAAFPFVFRPSKR